jgi:hypothetical protein
MKLFVAIAAHATLVPHFLRHYRAAGVTQFFVAVDAGLEEQVARLANGFPATIVRGLDTSESIAGGTSAVSQMREAFAQPDEWVVLTDLDEFQAHPLSVSATAATADAEHANVVRGRLVDRVATDGQLKRVGPDDDLWQLFPEESHVTERLQGGLAYKCALVKGRLESGRNEDGLSLAHHHMRGERVASRSVDIHHFKWNAEAIERMTLAIARTRAAGQPFWVEYERVLEHLRRHGRLRWEDFTDER